MAIVNSLALGKASGSAGNLTYSTVQGRTIARQRVTEVFNPRTEAQQTQRGMMRDVVAVYRKLSHVVQGTFTQRKKHSSVYNQFVSMNIANVEAFEYDADRDIVYFYEGLFVGNGNISNDVMRCIAVDGEFVKASIVDPNVLSTLKIGDKLGCIYTDYAKQKIYNEIITLSSDDIATLKSDGYIEIVNPGFEMGLVAPYYVTADSRKSTSPTLIVIDDLPTV